MATGRRLLSAGILWAVLAVQALPVSAEPVLSQQALDAWAEDDPLRQDGLPWRAGMLLEEMGDAGAERSVAESVDAVEETYSVSEETAVELLEVALQLSLLDSDLPERPSPGAIEARLSRAIEELPEPLGRFEMLLRFYGLLPDEQDDAKAVASRAADVVAAALEMGLVEEIWPTVENWGHADRALVERLLAASPGHPAVLASVADSGWDVLDRAAIHTYLWRSGWYPDPYRALSSLLEAGAVPTAVAVWDEYRRRRAADLPGEGTVGVGLAEDLDRLAELKRGGRGAGQPTLAEWLPDSLAAALWLVGEEDDALQVMAHVPLPEPGVEPERPAPDAVRTAESDVDPLQSFFEADTRWKARNAALLRRQLLHDVFRPSERDPYEMAIELLRVRGEAMEGHVLDGSMWPRVAAAWAGQRGQFALERFFLIDARSKGEYFQPAETAEGRSIRWRYAVEEGLIPVDLYLQRKELHEQLQEILERDLRRIRGLDFAAAGFFEQAPITRATDDAGETLDGIGPFTVRVLDDPTDPGRPEPSSDVPPTLPVDGDRVVDVYRDGDLWWLLHRGTTGGSGVDFAGESSPGPGRYSNWHSWGYWLARSDDGGHSWAPSVHTGLLARESLEVRPGTFAVESGTLRLRAMRVESYPGMTLMVREENERAETYELEADLSDLWRDTDDDGWTDVFEIGLFTDSTSEDSDGDGLLDPFDPLPLHDAEPSRQSEALDAALLEAIESGSAVERFRRRRAADASAVTDALRFDPSEPMEPMRWIGPDLPLATVAPGFQMVVLPEALANDPTTGGRLATRIRLWIMNRTSDRALLVWSGFGYGTMEMVRGEAGWYPVAGHRGGGCIVMNIEPPAEELLRPEG